jgi:hypothetical protein
VSFGPSFWWQRWHSVAQDNLSFQLVVMGLSFHPGRRRCGALRPKTRPAEHQLKLNLFTCRSNISISS